MVDSRKSMVVCSYNFSYLGGCYQKDEALGFILENPILINQEWYELLIPVTQGGIARMVVV
jgi:hypothetical protein